MNEKSGKETLYTVYGPKMLEDMAWTEVEEALKETDIVLPCVGAVENHGPHSPLSSDCIQAVEVAKRAAIKLANEGIKVVVGPLIPFGYSTHHMGFPGPITLRATTFHLLLKEVFQCLVHHGFKNIAVINGHGGNLASLYLAADELSADTKARIAVPDWFVPMYQKYLEVAKSKDSTREFHQGERGTCLTLAARPELVDMSKAGKYFNEDYERKLKAYGKCVNMPYLINYDARGATPLGYIGDAAAATEEVGEILYETSAEFIAEFVKNEFIKKQE